MENKELQTQSILSLFKTWSNDDQLSLIQKLMKEAKIVVINDFEKGSFHYRFHCFLMSGVISSMQQVVTQESHQRCFDTYSLIAEQSEIYSEFSGGFHFAKSCENLSDAYTYEPIIESKRKQLFWKTCCKYHELSDIIITCNLNLGGQILSINLEDLFISLIIGEKMSEIDIRLLLSLFGFVKETDEIIARKNELFEKYGKSNYNLIKHFRGLQFGALDREAY